MQEIYRILKFGKKIKPYFIGIAFLVLINSFLQLPIPFLIGKITDKLINYNVENGSTKAIIGMVIMIGVIEVSRALISNINGYLGDIMTEKLTTELWSKFYTHIMSLGVDFFDARKSGELVSQMERGNISIINFIHMMSNNFLSMFITVIISLVAISFYSWPVAVILLVILPIYIKITKISSEKFQKREHQKNAVVDSIWARIVESISQVRVVKIFRRENIEYQNGHKGRKKIEDIEVIKSKEWHYYDFYRQAILGIGIAVIVAYIVWQTIRGYITIGEMTILLTLVNQTRFPLFGTSFVIENGQRAITGSTDYFKILDTKPSIIDAEDAKDYQFQTGDIEFKDVFFNYGDDSKHVLKGVSFSFPGNQKTAIVGESGQGKTTITNLICRFYDTNSGVIRIDGHDIKELTQASLRDNISVVFQDSILFSGTILENILYGLPAKKLHELKKDQLEKLAIEAAKKADADNFIQGFTDGYQTIVGERGVKLSGGQKQRISIARAFIKDAPILILDEATSSLDTRAEIEVQDALNKLMRDRTTIIIAHRLSTIATVDQIITIKDGLVEEIGSPEVLAKGNGTYANLLKLQSERDRFSQIENKFREYEIS